MPLTITSLIIVVFGILPGLLGNSIHDHFTDTDPKESQTDIIFRIVLFSVLGIIIYILIFINFFKFPLPIYLFPDTFEKGSFTVEELTTLSISLGIHFICSSIMGFGFSFITKTPRNANISNSWKIFARDDMKDRWVVVSLKNGLSYAGYISHCDPSPDSDKRDIIITEPALYCKKSKNYSSLQYQHMYLPGSFIDSIAIVHDPEIDSNRKTKPGTLIFPPDKKCEEG
jgi:hypothetical protein